MSRHVKQWSMNKGSVTETAEAARPPPTPHTLQSLHQVLSAATLPTGPALTHH